VAIAVFGAKVFQVTSSKIHTFDELQYGSTLETEKQDAAGKKPSTYNKGPGLNSLSAKINLDVALGLNPRRELEEWEAIKDDAVAYPFILGGRPLGNHKWLLVDVQTDKLRIDNLGNILSGTLSLKFDEFVRPGSAGAKKSGSKRTPGVSSQETAKNISLLSPSEKGRLKRNIR